jgi:hypothetical protein
MSGEAYSTAVPTMVAAAILAIGSRLVADTGLAKTIVNPRGLVRR